MEPISLVAAGWSAGLNAYLTVLVLGVTGRFGWADTPHSLQGNAVLAAAASMFAVEFVVDKVPMLDSAWDLVHTLVRPCVAAAVGGAIAGAEIGRPWAAFAAAGLALAGHTTKASTRLAINVSPEPFTNIAASVAEDSIVVTLVALAITRPRLAAVLALIALAAGLTIAVLLFRLARRGLLSVNAFVRARQREPRA